jgi:hypothetical protein
MCHFHNEHYAVLEILLETLKWQVLGIEPCTFARFRQGTYHLNVTSKIVWGCIIFVHSNAKL